MELRQTLVVGGAIGLLWSVLLVVVAARFVQVPVFALMPTIMTSFLAPGLVVLAMVARLTQKRFRDDEMLRGGPLSGSAVIDRQVLDNTILQIVLALCIWPAAAVVLGGMGPGVIAALGLGFAVARLAYWAGCHRAPLLRSFGFAASVLPTAFVALWAVCRLIFGFG